MEILKIVEVLESASQKQIACYMGYELADAVSEAASLLVGQGEKIADLENKVAEMEARNRWIPVTARLPDNGYPVLCAPGKGCRPIIARYSSACNEWRVPFALRITHWMPLPEPPKEDE